jgi:hypothetical protein
MQVAHAQRLHRSGFRACADLPAPRDESAATMASGRRARSRRYAKIAAGLASDAIGTNPFMEKSATSATAVR